MNFSSRLAALRKERGLTQPELAERIDIHVSQLRRYEAGTSQPTLPVLRRIAKALSISADMLLFDEEEREIDSSMKDQFQAIATLDEDEKQVVRSVIEGALLKHEAKRWTKVT